MLWEELLCLRREYPRPVDVMQLSQRLRKQWSAAEAIWLAQQLKLYWDALRLEAFAEAEGLLFEAQALQMGTRWPLARRRSEEMRRRFPDGLLLEIGAGIGGDSLELVRRGPLRAVEQDADRLECLRHNLRETGAEVLGGDGLQQAQGAVAVYADPARRDEGGRTSRWIPQPEQVWNLGLPSCLKLAPGLDERELPPDCDLEYVSHQGVCKEAVVWRPGSGRVMAWMHHQGLWHQAERRTEPPLGQLEEGMWLHELDPAAIRARAWPAPGWRIDESLSLLASEAGESSVWAQSFEVLQIADADLKNLKKLQKRWDFYPLEIKKRGFDVDPEELRRKLPRGNGGGPGVLWLTRVAGRHRVVICRRAPVPWKS